MGFRIVTYHVAAFRKKTDKIHGPRAITPIQIRNLYLRLRLPYSLAFALQTQDCSNRVLNQAPASHRPSLPIKCSHTPLAIPLAMDGSPAPSPGQLLLDMYFKINGPGIPGESHYTLPTKTSMSNIVRDGVSFKDVHEIARARFSGHVFASDDEDGWFRALDLIAQARKTITCPYHNDVDPPFIAIFPLEQDLPAGVTRHTFKYEDILPKTKEYMCERAPDFFDGDCQLENLPLPGDLSDDDL
ncbi:hypothetical protein MKX08_004446 [Trichoderma sp. CBMAI-0020]|nr:hypothetical protein MKX08_004446 [Trichoderma sp. CBMAI-0020]